MKRALRWTIRLLLVLLGIVILAWLLSDTLIRSFAERRLRRKTGLEVTIAQSTVGLISGTVALKDFKAFNPPGFGGAMLLNVSEASCVLDLQQFKIDRLHFHELKLHLAELNVIKSKTGVLNLDSVKESIRIHALQDRNKKKWIFRFAGIDRLELSVDRLNYIDEQTPANSLQFNLQVKSEVVTNLQTEQTFNTWLNAFLIRMALQEYTKDPGPMRARIKVLWERVWPLGTGERGLREENWRAQPRTAGNRFKAPLPSEAVVVTHIFRNINVSFLGTSASDNASDAGLRLPPSFSFA